MSLVMRYSAVVLTLALAAAFALGLCVMIGRAMMIQAGF
ncbi:MAG: hypothetical protein UZ13_02849 [Chloroflexi bacterium OLB13]|jgi:hypothetical protein|nr:MAG: hypothetical protein UZ13_02849 [Chloroflexi bacterium OLB13]